MVGPLLDVYLWIQLDSEPPTPKVLPGGPQMLQYLSYWSLSGLSDHP